METSGVSWGLLETGDSLSSLFIWATREILMFSRTWILCSNNVKALGSNELKWETPFPADNCLNKPFKKPSMAVREAAAAAACPRQWRERSAAAFFTWSSVCCGNCCDVPRVHRCEMTLHGKTAQQKPLSLSLCFLKQNFWETLPQVFWLILTLQMSTFCYRSAL